MRVIYKDFPKLFNTIKDPSVKTSNILNKTFLNFETFIRHSFYHRIERVSSHDYSH